MSYFLKHVARLTWSVYLVKAEDAEAALMADSEYLGVFDEDLPEHFTDSDGVKTFGPFETKTDAKNDTSAWVEQEN
jgi:hypothetical protein